MQIGFIGAGKVGTALACLLKRADYQITGIYSRSSAAEAAEFAGIKEYADCSSLLAASDVVFLTVSDGAIANVASEIAAYVRPGQCFIHCSGALTADVMQPCRDKGGLLYSLHPLQSFADRQNAVLHLPGSFFSGQGDAEVKPLAMAIASALRGTFAEISAEGKALYHAGACVASNYLVTLIDLAQSFYAEIGIPPEKALQALQPLLAGTLQNISRLGTVQALTGPIARGDAATLAVHLRQMKNPLSRNLYCALGRSTVELAAKKGSLSAGQIDELKKQLRSEE